MFVLDLNSLSTIYQLNKRSKVNNCEITIIYVLIYHIFHHNIYSIHPILYFDSIINFGMEKITKKWMAVFIRTIPIILFPHIFFAPFCILCFYFIFFDF